MNINIYNRTLFWDTQHRIQNTQTLSDSSFEQMVDGLALSSLLFPKMRILEIGVGIGKATEQMRERNYKVSALDISMRALHNVRRFCEKIYTVNRIEFLPSDYFDLIVCCNVVQHTPTKILEIQINECMRALKSTGTFVIQFVSCGPVDDLGAVVDPNESELGCYGRSAHFMERLFATYDGVCSIVSAAKVNIPPVTDSYVFHVTKVQKHVQE